MSSEKYPEGAIPCLNKGFIRLIDSMGSDEAIVQAARVSYGKGTTRVSRDRGLIRYLMRHKHTTPFEMVEFKFHCKIPIFVARQWVRHRTANINEYSLRYSEARDDFYIPDEEHVLFQSELNRQGRSVKEVPTVLKKQVRDHFINMSNQSYDVYQEMNEAGIARELARAVLPVNLYTEWYWKNDLNNILHFLMLRKDQHAQYEIRVYAEAMANIIKEIVPIAYEAFEDYVVNSWSFTELEKDTFNRTVPDRIKNDMLEDIIYSIVASTAKNKDYDLAKLWSIYKQEYGRDDQGDFELKFMSHKDKTGNVFELRESRDKILNLVN
jgi:thymidylate synthase (FAD)